MRVIASIIIFVVAIMLCAFGFSLDNDTMVSTGLIFLVINLSTEIIVEAIKNKGDNK